MHHQASVRRGDRSAGLGDEPDALTDAALLAVGEPGDRLPFDQLESEIRPAVARDTAVEQAGDIGMVEPRQDLALGEKAAHDLARVEVAAHQLERHLLLELAVGALRPPDFAHAAPPQAGAQPVRTDAVAGFGS